MASTNQTQHYGLSQWEGTDNFVRTDFNEDNSKVDAALKRVEDMAQESHRALPFISYTVYNLVLQNYYQGKLTGIRKAMLFDGFMQSDMIESTTGGADVYNNAMCLSGVGAVGSVITPNIYVGTNWEKAICWVRSSGGDVFPSINGVEMPKTDTSGSTSMQGDPCWEREFTLTVAGSTSVVVTLRMECKTSASMKVYDYGIIFL